MRLHYIGMVDKIFGHTKTPDSLNLLTLQKTIPEACTPGASQPALTLVMTGVGPRSDPMH